MYKIVDNGSCKSCMNMNIIIIYLRELIVGSVSLGSLDCMHTCIEMLNQVDADYIVIASYTPFLISWHFTKIEDKTFEIQPKA